MNDKTPTIRYDAGLLNDFGGGNVEWWQDYIRAELDRSHDYYTDTIEALQSRNEALEAALRIEIWNGLKRNGMSDDAATATVKARMAALEEQQP